MAPLSGAEKRKRKRQDEAMIKSQAGSLHKFFNKPTLEEQEHIEETEGQEHIEEQEAEKEEHVETNINGHELYMELNSFDIIGAGEFKNPLDVLKHVNEAQENFPNARIAYRILLTIPVTVASAEMSFSKLKLMKSYLRSTMSQQRLSGLAMMTIENEILESISCEEVIKQFATKNARRGSRIIG